MFGRPEFHSFCKHHIPLIGYSGEATVNHFELTNGLREHEAQKPLELANVKSGQVEKIKREITAIQEETQEKTTKGTSVIRGGPSTEDISSFAGRSILDTGFNRVSRTARALGIIVEYV